jgi:methylenetetrahydrofolate--tRNA-(uracil-5-)-methyltransferase
MGANSIRVIGGGLAGAEAAWQISRRGFKVDLFEMRPQRMTPAHQTAQLAEIVCSNSFKSDQENSAPWLLKRELQLLDSLLLKLAYQYRVPSGASLSVDRELFASAVTEILLASPLIQIRREEVTSIPPDGITIVATGPLTSDRLANALQVISGSQNLYFYDALSPIVDSETVDYSKVFRASRYNKGNADYLNCPFTKEEYLRFYEALIQAESVPLQECEKSLYFEACLPVEEMARRGVDTLRFGPMKPVGLIDPRTGQIPYAAVQLRQENLRADSYNLVGFQNHLRFGAQEKVLRLIPGLENACFTHFGQIHRNTYINAPLLLNPTLQTRTNPLLFFAGQISGVEGYVECIATGLLAGINAARLRQEQMPISPPRVTALGSLVQYLCSADPAHFQPENINFGIMPPLILPPSNRKISKQEKHQIQVQQALHAMKEFGAQVSTG